MTQKSFDFLVEAPKIALEHHQLRDHNQNSIPNHTPFLHEVRMQDDGGVIAIQGLEYQHYFTISKCLDLIDNPQEFEFVSAEAHNDVVVKRVNGSYDFYQVKTRTGNPWTLGTLNGEDVWLNFLRLQRTFGHQHTFWFVSNQTAQNGRKHQYDLAQMKRITCLGRSMCNERDLQIAENLIDQLFKFLAQEGTNRGEIECLFWNTRILTDHEREKGLRATNLLAIEKILQNRGVSCDPQNRERIHNTLKELIIAKVSAVHSASYTDNIKRRAMKLEDIEPCLCGPYQLAHLKQFDVYNNANHLSLVEKTERAEFPEHIKLYFLESRNYFSFNYSKDVIYAGDYLARLRMKVWDVCVRQQISPDIDNAVTEYSKIREGLAKLAEKENQANPPIAIDFDYLHGMLCQLTAECHHNWYKTTTYNHG